MFSSKEVLITIVKRNYLIFLILLAGSFTFGLITLFQLIWLTAWFGIEIGVFARQYGINFCIRGIMPHAPLEMVSFLIISTISFYILQNFIIYLLKKYMYSSGDQALDVFFSFR